MTSDHILISFPPINFERALTYLKNMSGPLSSLIDDFSNLSEEQMASYNYPPYVSRMKTDYLNDKFGKDSAGFKSFNSAILAINLLKACAKLNLAIYTLRDKYKAMELQSNRGYVGVSYYSTPAWYNSTDEDVLRIKNSAIAVRDQLHGYSKKYTVDGFEENFINTIKYSVYSICDKFFVDTKTVTEKATEAGANVAGTIMAIVIFCSLFWLVAKCATSL